MFHLKKYFSRDSAFFPLLKVLSSDIKTLARSYRSWEKLEAVIPAIVNAEPANICNARCVFCPYSKTSSWRKEKGLMSEQIFEKILIDFKEAGVRRISFGCIEGDPLIEPQIIERIERCTKAGFSSMLYTNGILLERFDTEKLVNSGLGKIYISTSPFAKEHHERVYRTKHYDALLRGVIGLLETRNRMRSSLFVGISFRANISLQDTWTLPDFAKIRPLLSKVELSLLEDQLLNIFDSWGGLITKDDLVGSMRLAISPRFKFLPCVMTFNNPIVLYDGTVRACACRYGTEEFQNDVSNDNDLIIGNIQKESFTEIWMGEAIRKLRRRFVSGDLPVVCQKCSLYQAC